MSQDGIYYHVWFPTKRHRRILLGEVEEKVFELFRQIAEEKGYDLIACEAMVDHVHLLLRLSPEQDLSTAIKMFKGISARRVFQAFPNLKMDIGLNNLWARRYGSKTIPPERIPRLIAYIQNQKKDYSKYEPRRPLR